mgnify:CR=1 FL=1
MTSIFSDEQRTSLIDSMTNPESNARKMIEQNADIGMSPDLTTQILNKYATYGANTGIGNIGGGKLVNALNERYRDRVDAPLRASNGTASGVGAAAGLDANFGQTLEELRRLQEQMLGENTLSAEAMDAELGGMNEAIKLEAETMESLNSPVSLEGRKGIDEFGSSLPDQDIASPIDLEGIDVESKLEQLKRYLENNPVVAQQIGKSLGTGLGIAAKAAVGEDDTPRTISAPRPRFQSGQVRNRPIGMSEGGEAAAGTGINMGLMSILQALGGILGNELISEDDTERLIAAVKAKNQPTSRIDADPIEMEDGGTVLNRKMFLGGGEVDGPGGEKEDLVPIWASPNEYVVSAKGVRRMGGGDLQQGIAALDRINFGDQQNV